MPVSKRFAVRLALGLFVAGGMPALFAGAASAATVTLYAAPSAIGSMSCADAADACPLSQAITQAAADTTVTIYLAAGTYPAESISTGSESLTLVGPGAVIDGVTVNSAALSLTLEQLSIENGSPGIAVSAATGVTLLGTSVIYNTTDGLAASAGTILIEDSTIAANGAHGVLDSGDASPISIYGTSFDGNGSGGVEASGAGTAINIGADVLYGNGTHDCATASSGAINDQGYDDSEDSTCPSTTSTSTNGDSTLMLATPAANGGPTDTSRIESVADPALAVPAAVTIGSEAAPFCAGADERGVARTQGPAGSCDAGSYQYAPPVITGVSPRSALEPGLTLTLSGYGFANVTAAGFGSTPAPITGQSDTRLTLTVPTLLPVGSQPVTLTNPDGSTQVSFSAVAFPSISSWILTPGEFRVPYSQPVPTAGGAGPFAFKLVSGALPAGLTLASTGLLSGTPTKAGGSAFGVQAIDANGITSPVMNVSLVIATPVVTFTATHVSVSVGGGVIPLALNCQSAPCAGSVTLGEKVSIKLPNHKTGTKTLALASAAYTLAPGQAGTVELALTPQGLHVLDRRALRRARKHPLSETLSATVAGGTTESAMVAVR